MQEQAKKEVLRRLKTASGHLNYVIRMVEEERYCPDILQQSIAVQSALRVVDKILLKGHLEEHVSKAMGGDNKDKSIQEVVEVFEKARR